MINKKNNKADIFTDRNTGDIVVINADGEVVFRRKKDVKTVAIAHNIYMYHRYKENDYKGALA